MIKTSADIIQTCFKWSFESFVNSGRVAVTFEINPDNASFTLYWTWLGFSTQSFGQYWTGETFEKFAIIILRNCFTELNIIISAVFTILQIKRVEVYLDLPSLRNN